MRTLVENADASRAGRHLRSDDQLVSAVSAILEDRSLEPAFVALALVPPGESDIAREIAQDIDPDAIFQARTALRAEIGDRLTPLLTAAYDQMAVNGGYVPDAQSAGCRALKNVALDLLAGSGRASAVTRAARHYHDADNMTDRMAALAALSLHDVHERNQALDDFYIRYASDALVIDKWFTLQAVIPHPETLTRVRALTAHPAFSMSNPNRVRAFVGAFAHGNATQFNRADGAGYMFIAETILALDPKNPQVSARLATAFRSWRILEKNRQSKAETALNRIKASSGISRDLSDIVERALAAP